MPNKDKFKLCKPWDESGFEGIMVYLSDHAHRAQYQWMTDCFNCKFSSAKITTKEMCALDFFVDKNAQDKMVENPILKVANPIEG